MAVACGHTESIAKLFSIQRRRIQTLERSSIEAQMNNEEVERCLNFLSREYVEMRYQVRKGPKKDREDTKTLQKEKAREKDKENEGEELNEKECEKEMPKPDQNNTNEEKDKDTDEEPLLIEDVEEGELKHHSEPEKEPSLSARQTHATADRASECHQTQTEVIHEDRESLSKFVPERMPRHSAPGGNGQGHGQSYQTQASANYALHPPCLLGAANAAHAAHAASPKGVSSVSGVSGVSPKMGNGATRHRGTPTSEHPPRAPHLRRPHEQTGPTGPTGPTVSPKERSPYTHVAHGGEGFDRRGHKLAMAHQRVLNRCSAGKKYFSFAFQ